MCRFYIDSILGASAGENALRIAHFHGGLLRALPAVQSGWTMHTRSMCLRSP